MTRILRRVAVLTLLGALAGGPPARAQSYPPGYHGYGWNGWGGGAHTTAGHAAAGMGVYAAGAGQYNVQTAQARSMNAQTAMGLNNYAYECNQRNLKMYYDEQAREQKKHEKGWEEMTQRILDNPTDTDISSGDTLNALYHLLTNPKVYGRTLAAATQPFPGAVIRRIPFTYAAGGFTYSLSELLSRENIPTVFKEPAFDQQRKTMRALSKELRKEANEGQPKPETLKKFRAELEQVKATLESITQPGSDRRLDGEKYLKAIYGVARMLDSPSYDIYLAAVQKVPSVPLSEVLEFMHAFNLQFGPAKTPDDRETYSQLYGSLSDLRQKVDAPTSDMIAAANNGPKPDQRVTEFFSGMDYSHFNKPGGPPPPPPAARP